MENESPDRVEVIQVNLNTQSEKAEVSGFEILVACAPAIITLLASVIVVILTQWWSKRNEVRLKFYERRLDALAKINESASLFFNSMAEMYHKKKRGKECIEHVHQYFVELGRSIDAAGIYLTKDEKALVEDCQLRVALIQYTNWKTKISKQDYDAMLVIKCFLDDTIREIALDRQPRWMRQGRRKKAPKKSSKKTS
jgi:hypothetical protein